MAMANGVHHVEDVDSLPFVLTDHHPEDIYQILPKLGLHKHCASCFSFTRCTHDKDSCDFFSCACGAVLHECKIDQHSECCLMEQVPCLNKEYGCDRILPRGKRSAHLLECPANVIMCKAEWNRWPVYCIDRRKHIPFRQLNPHACQGQLDYDLTLRDQRMLESLKKLPRRTKLCLRNYLTRRFPAVPVPAGAVARANDSPEVEELQLDVDDENCIEAGDDTTYIGARKKAAFTEQMKRWQDDLDARLKGKVIPPKYWEFPELEKGNIHKHCAYCFKTDCEKSKDVFVSYDELACQIFLCRYGCGAKFHICKLSEHMLVCPDYEPQDEYEWMFRGINNVREKKSLKSKHILLKDSVRHCITLERTWPEMKPDPAQKTSPSKKSSPSKPAAPLPPTNLHVVCPLDIRLDTVTRLQSKPKSMYTFVCAQEFKRADYGWHYKNIHSEIHGGLNNWLEHRCPLAVYGCGFSSRRLFPSSANNNLTVIYSSAVEGFGVTVVDNVNSSEKRAPKKGSSSTPTKKIVTPKNGFVGQKNNKPVSLLSDLPFEMLEKIFRMLDSFSLCNLSLTCSYFRDVCCSILDTNGCVSLQWERIKRGPKLYHWQVSYKRWFFSPALDPIEKWSLLSSDGALAEHMKKCPYNLRTVHRPISKSDEKWKKVLVGLEVKMKEKRSSEWFIQ